MCVSGAAVVYLLLVCGPVVLCPSVGICALSLCDVDWTAAAQNHYIIATNVWNPKKSIRRKVIFFLCLFTALKRFWACLLSISIGFSLILSSIWNGCFLFIVTVDEVQVHVLVDVKCTFQWIISSYCKSQRRPCKKRPFKMTHINKLILAEKHTHTYERTCKSTHKHAFAYCHVHFPTPPKANRHHELIFISLLSFFVLFL